MRNELMNQITAIVVDECAKATVAANEWKLFVKRSLPYEKAMIRALRPYFIRQQRKINIALTKYYKAVSFPFLEKTFISSQKDELSRVIFPLIKRVVSTEGAYNLRRIKSRVNLAIAEFNVTDEVKESIQDLVKTAASEVTETTFKKMLKEYDEGQASGETFAEIKERIAKIYNEALTSRVNLIARTEVIKSMNESRLQAYRQSEVVSKVQFYAALDERVCPTCKAYHMKVYPLTSKNKPVIPVHPRCRCCWLPVVNAEYLKAVDTTIEKMGTANSGNHGHSGRPGKVGGSASGTGKAFAECSSEIVKTMLDESKRVGQLVGEQNGIEVAVGTDVNDNLVKPYSTLQRSYYNSQLAQYNTQLNSELEYGWATSCNIDSLINSNAIAVNHVHPTGDILGFSVPDYVVFVYTPQLKRFSATSKTGEVITMVKSKDFKPPVYDDEDRLRQSSSLYRKIAVGSLRDSLYGKLDNRILISGSKDLLKALEARKDIDYNPALWREYTNHLETILNSEMDKYGISCIKPEAKKSFIDTAIIMKAAKKTKRSKELILDDSMLDLNYYKNNIWKKKKKSKKVKILGLATIFKHKENDQ